MKQIKVFLVRNTKNICATAHVYSEEKLTEKDLKELDVFPYRYSLDSVWLGSPGRRSCEYSGVDLDIFLAMYCLADKSYKVEVLEQVNMGKEVRKFEYCLLPPTANIEALMHQYLYQAIA